MTSLGLCVYMCICVLFFPLTNCTYKISIKNYAALDSISFLFGSLICINIHLSMCTKKENKEKLNEFVYGVLMLVGAVFMKEKERKNCA